jgi:hypothetical protein
MKEKRTISLKLAPGFFVTLMKALAIVMVWRGAWELLDMYLLPGNPILSNVVCIVVGVFLLYLPDQSIEDLV